MGNNYGHDKFLNKSRLWASEIIKNWKKKYPCLPAQDTKIHKLTSGWWWSHLIANKMYFNMKTQIFTVIAHNWYSRKKTAPSSLFSLGTSYFTNTAMSDLLYTHYQMHIFHTMQGSSSPWHSSFSNAYLWGHTWQLSYFLSPKEIFSFPLYILFQKYKRSHPFVVSCVLWIFQVC